VDLVPEQTLFINSLSQVTVAGVRIGFMVIPPKLYDRFLMAKFNADLASTGLLQKFLRRFIQNGNFQAHLKATIAGIAQRRHQVQAILAEVPQLSIPEDQRGYGVWVRTPVELPGADVPWCSGAEFSFSAEARHYLKISFMHIDDRDFNGALSFLQEALQLHINAGCNTAGSSGLTGR
jgi:DNA-binding transcriptional MocR family regulator